MVCLSISLTFCINVYIEREINVSYLNIEKKNTVFQTDRHADKTITISIKQKRVRVVLFVFIFGYNLK